MSRRPNSETLSGEVRERLRADILSAQWPPGAKLQVAQLSERYSTSTTVVREALTRLTGERLVQFKPNRGFFITDLTLDELRDLNELRCRVEEFGIALSIDRGDLTWESELIATHHILERTPRRRHDDPHRISEAWSAAHRAFHAKLLEACRFEQLTTLASTLADTTLLYRQISAPSPQAEMRDIEAEHRAILDAVLARDAVAAARQLREHYTRSLDVIVAAGLVGTGDEPASHKPAVG